MDDNSIYEEQPDQQQWQPGMPSPDAAWDNMLAKLEAEMPVADAITNNTNPKLLRNSTMCLIAVLCLLLNVKHIRENFSNQPIAAHTTKILHSIKQPKGQLLITEIKNSNPALTLKSNTENDRLIKNNLLQNGSKNNKKSVQPLSAFAAHKSNEIIIGKSNSALQHILETDTQLNREVIALNTFKPAILKTKQPKFLSEDSSQNADSKTEEDKLNVQAGLQWTVPLPVAGASNYFAGPSASNQPWRVLLPGAWIHFKAGKNLFMAEINPFAMASFRPSSFYTDAQINGAIASETNKALTKVFGISGAISYQHNVYDNWWLGAGLQTNFWNKGLAILTLKQHDNVANTTSFSTNAYTISKADWQNFSRFQLYPHVQLMYRSNSYQAGLRSGITFTSLAKDKGTKNLVFTQLFFRVPLISNKQ